MVAGLWLGGYHPAGYLLAALPIVAWLAFALVGFVAQLQIGTRRRRAIRERLAALQAEGFSARVVCEGDLARGEAWAAFDPAADAARIISAEGVRCFALSQLGSLHIDEPRRLGDPTPLYYVLSLYFGDPDARFQAELRAGIATTSRREAERWQSEIEALKASSRPRSPADAA